VSTRKNIVFFMVDQLRWDAAFDERNPCRMPGLLRFGEKGVRFDKAYTICPLCSPARAAVFTGLLPHQTGFIDNVCAFWPNRTLNPEYRTYLERLQDSGYTVTYTGKWHVGKGGLVERGVDDVRCSDGGHTPGKPTYKTEPLKRVGEWFKPYYEAYSEGTNRDRIRTDAGKDQLRECVAGFHEDGKPFCSVISLSGPHFSHCIPKRYAHMYELPQDFVPDNFCPPFTEEKKPHVLGRAHWPSQETADLTPEDWRKTAQHYWGYCSYIDDLFSEVLHLLDEEDLWEDTVVAFTPDHGEMLGAHGRFDKGPDFYEETVHLPFVIWDPARREPVNRNSYVNLVDLYPTLISLAGASEVLSDDEKARSMWTTNHGHTCMCYDGYQGRHFMVRGIRTDRYKYTWRPRDLDELYDMQEDPGERNNLIDSPRHEAVILELRKKLDAWMEREGDYLRHAKHVPEPGSFADGRCYDTPMVCAPGQEPTRGRD
jgi:arylsulfatase A-like enzyme